MVSAAESSRLFTLFSEQANKIDVVLNEKRDIDTARTLIQELQSTVSSYGAVLPPRDLKTYGERIEGFKRRLDELKAPKKKFTFSKATKEAHSERVQEQGDKVKPPTTVPATPSTKDATFLIENKQSETFELSDIHGDVEIRNIKASKIVLRGSPNTLYINEVDNSEIICEPVASSVLIVGFRDSSLQVACQQLRIHKSSNATFRLHITSRSIIEECHDLRFGPLPKDFIVSEDRWKSSGLNASTNNYSAVDDFNWLNTSQPSPNWKLID